MVSCVTLPAMNRQGWEEEWMAERMKILLVDDHEMFRAGLRELINREQDMEVIAEATDGRTALHLVGKTRPDVVIMDIMMPGLNGIDATAQIRRQCPQTQVVALSAHGDRRFVIGVVQAGASGYVLKESAFEELAFALRTVAQGKTYLSPSVATIVVEDLRNLARQVQYSPLAALTGKEREVLQLIAEGKSTKEIASILCLSPKTVETHRQHLMDKLNLHSIAELTRFAIREGLIDG